MSERPIDHAWEALVEVTSANVSAERGQLNRALSLIRTATSVLDASDEELAMMIRHQGSLYREVFPTMPLTANALAKWWGKLEEEANRLRDHASAEASKLEEKRKTRGVNLHARSDCTLCQGDHWVIVGYRPPITTVWMSERGIEPKPHSSERGHEQTAPCPACNLDPPVMKNFWDGRSWGYGSEPGEVVIT